MKIIFEFDDGVKCSVDICEDIGKKILLDIIYPKQQIRNKKIDSNYLNVPDRKIILEYIENKPHFEHNLYDIIQYVKHIGYISPSGEFSNISWENAIRSKVERIRKYISRTYHGKWVYSTEPNKYRTYKFVW